MELRTGLHRIGDDLVACYLVVTPEGATLVDAALPGYRRDLQRELADIGIAESDIRGIVLTHGDTDHIGFAEALRAEHGTPVFVHEADAARATGAARAPSTPMPAWRLGAALAFLWTAVRKSGRVRRPAEVTTVTDGEVLPLPGGPRIIGMPGHSPGSIAVHLPEHDAVCVGDALTTRHVLTGEARPQAAPFTDDDAEAAASLARLRGLGATWVLPGHGVVWQQGSEALLDALEAPRG